MRKRSHDYQDKIVIARELFPSDALKLFSQKIKGIILLSGGATSHVAILARSLNIPLVVTNELALLSLDPTTDVLLDAYMGYIHINPDPLVKAKVLQREELNRNIGEFKKDDPGASQDQRWCCGQTHGQYQSVGGPESGE